MVALKVKGFFLDRDKMPVAVLADESGKRLLPVRTEPSEASAIIMRLQHIQPPQPQAHDLLADLFQRHGLRMERLEIGETGEPAVCSSTIVYRSLLRRRRLRARASDGLALAVRLGAPIVASEPLLEQSGISTLEPLLGESASSVLFLSTASAAGSRSPGPARGCSAGKPFN